MAEALAKLTAYKKRHDYIKVQLTKLINYATHIKATTNIEDIKVRLANVERYRNEFIELETKIVTLDSNEELDLDFEENYYKAVSGLNLALRSKLDQPISLNDTTADTSLSHSHVDVKLPKLSIPYFSGDYTEWQSFYDLFCSTIHDNQKLTPSQKLQYLKGTLKGEAAGLLKHLSTTDANYIEGLNKLRERYDRKKHTIHMFIKNFITQPNITVSNSTNVRRLLDTSDEIIRGLKALGEEAESRDHWLIQIMVGKLDEITNGLWAQASARYDLPSLKQFFEFLTRRIDALESLKDDNKRQNQSKPNLKSHVVFSGQSCVLCPNDEHKLYGCPKFNQMSVEERRLFLKKTNRCFNCLNDTHSVYNCKSRFRCRECNKKHNSLVHATPVTNPKQDSAVNSSSNQEGSAICNITTSIGSAVLPTALVYVADRNNQSHLCRVLLDSGSQESFITESCANKLQLRRTAAKFLISGIGASTTGFTKGLVSLTVTPWNKNQPRLQISAYVFPKLTTKQSSISKFIDINYFKKFHLADPYFHKCHEIDIIIGSDTFFEILSDGKIITPYQLILQNTHLGWVVAGKSNESHMKQSLTITLHDESNNYLENCLKRFWEIESINSNNTNFTTEEELCENHFLKTTTIDASGRFYVRLPFKLSPSNLGNSFQTAAQRMYAMERKFKKNPEFAKMYKDFMAEYLSLGHMSPIRKSESTQHGYYLPHHGVIKNSSTTTKLRVVFDGSSKTTTGKSLNNCLAVGPTVQSTLFEILLRFRIFKVVFTADIEKMYRQIRISKDETKYQCIIWRDSADKPFTTYKLQTVTYGTASATY